MSEWTIAGRTVVVTGGSRGIGRAAAEALARFGAHVVLVGRDRQRHQPVLDVIDSAGGMATLVEADLSDLSAVARAAGTLREADPPVTVLINNAGVAGARGVTVDGFEMAFGVNHLAHFLLTRLLLDVIVVHSPGRILTLSSDAHLGMGSLDLEGVVGSTRSWFGASEYRRSKAANVAFTVELSRRLAGTGVVAAAVHPGLVATGIWRSLPTPIRALLTMRMVTPEVGAALLVDCATVSELTPGGYYTPVGIGRAAGYATDPSTARTLWERSEELVARWL